MAAEIVALAISKFPFAIFVTLVTGDDDYGAGQFGAANGFEKVGGADGVGVKRLEWLRIGKANERLSGEMENDVRLDLCDGFGQLVRVAHVTLDFAFKAVGFDYVVKVWIGGGGQADAGDGRAQLVQPERKPAAFEPGMACNKNTFAFVEAVEHLPRVRIGAVLARDNKDWCLMVFLAFPAREKGTGWQ